MAKGWQRYSKKKKRGFFCLKKKKINLKKEKMILPGTKLIISDNSGVKMVRVINILGRRYASIGDVVVASTISVAPRTKQFKKGVVVRVLIVATKYARFGISFSMNLGIILKDGKEMAGTRVRFPIPFELIRLVPEMKKLFSVVPSML